MFVENFHWKFVWHLKVIRNKVISSVDTINISTFQCKDEWTILSLNADFCVDFLRKYIFQFQMHSVLYHSIRQEDCTINLIASYLFMEWIFTDLNRCCNTRWKWRLKKYCQLILINDKTETISYFPLHNIRAMKSKYISLAFQFPVKMILFVYIVGIRLAWNCSHWELQWCFPCTKMAKQKNETETLWLNGRASFSISL